MRGDAPPEGRQRRGLTIARFVVEPRLSSLAAIRRSSLRTGTAVSFQPVTDQV